MAAANSGLVGACLHQTPVILRHWSPRPPPISHPPMTLLHDTAEPSVGESGRFVEIRLPEPGGAPTRNPDTAEVGLGSEGAEWVIEALAAELRSEEHTSE